jgi:hypothetical protein
VRQVVASLPTSDARLAEILEVSRRRWNFGGKLSHL